MDEKRLERILESLPRGATVVLSRFNFVMWMLVILNQNCTEVEVETAYEPRTISKNVRYRSMSLVLLRS